MPTLNILGLFSSNVTGEPSNSIVDSVPLCPVLCLLDLSSSEIFHCFFKVAVKYTKMVLFGLFDYYVFLIHDGFFPTCNDKDGGILHPKYYSDS